MRNKRYKNQEFATKTENSKFHIFGQERPFGGLFAKITIKVFKRVLRFFRKPAKCENALFALQPSLYFVEYCTIFGIDCSWFFLELVVVKNYYNDCSFTETADVFFDFMVLFFRPDTPQFRRNIRGSFIERSWWSSRRRLHGGKQTTSLWKTIPSNIQNLWLLLSLWSSNRWGLEKTWQMFQQLHTKIYSHHLQSCSRQREGNTGKLSSLIFLSSTL